MLMSSQQTAIRAIFHRHTMWLYWWSSSSYDRARRAVLIGSLGGRVVHGVQYRYLTANVHPPEQLTHPVSLCPTLHAWSMDSTACLARRPLGVSCCNWAARHIDMRSLICELQYSRYGRTTAAIANTSTCMAHQYVSFYSTEHCTRWITSVKPLAKHMNIDPIYAIICSSI